MCPRVRLDDMKLFLTSNGLSHKKLAQAFVDLVGKPASETKIGFIPTAANVELGNKNWYVRQLVDLLQYGYTWIDVIDPSGGDVDDWRERLDAVDVVYLSGGNTFHLLNQIRKTGLGEWLDANKDRKVYAGASAGSIVMTPSIAVAGLEPGDENLAELTDLTGLGYVPFEIEPHCDGPRMERMIDYTAESPNPLYAIDDLTAIQVVDEQVQEISAGNWRRYEKETSQK